MPEESEKGCNIDDLMCQYGVMNHLEGMQKLLGSEKFKTRFPELTGFEETIASRISEQEVTIRAALEKCGRPPIENIIVQPSGVSEIIEEVE